MSIWQFSAALEGVRDANDPQAANRLSDAEAAELFAWVESKPIN